MEVADVWDVSCVIWKIYSIPTCLTVVLSPGSALKWKWRRYVLSNRVDLLQALHPTAMKRSNLP
jgi:hypothetical protein